MMKALFIALLLAVTHSANIFAAEEDGVLDVYVEVATALAADDLETARQASKKLAAMAAEGGETDLSKEAAAVSEASEIDEAREKFKRVSARVVSMAKGKDGYYIMNCPMTEHGTWVQNDPQVANPYFGKSMLRCGMIVED